MQMKAERVSYVFYVLGGWKMEERLYSAELEDTGRRFR